MRAQRFDALDVNALLSRRNCSRQIGVDASSLNIPLALNTQSLETGQCKADGSSHGSLVVPIELTITCIIFVSDHQLLNKLLSVLGQD